MKKVMLFVAAGAAVGAVAGLVNQITEPSASSGEKKPFKMPSALVALGTKVAPLAAAAVNDIIDEVADTIMNLRDKAGAQDDEALGNAHDNAPNDDASTTTEPAKDAVTA